MPDIFTASARGALIIGLIACAAILGLWLAASRVDLIGLVSFLVRWVHVMAAIVWVGMIWFVNTVQFAALAELDPATRGQFNRLVASRVARSYRLASHVTIASGLLLLITTGYLFDRWVFKSAVYVPPLKAMMLWGGTIAALCMWIFVNLIIWPKLRVLLGDAPEAEKAVARQGVLTFARLNLVLALPVTFVMVAAAHLY